MPILLIRHGETDGNRERFIGREDLPLNDVGRRQAAVLAQALASEPVGEIYSSPLSRARETAAPLAASLALDVRLRPGLVEIDYGALQGAAKGAFAFNLRRQYRHTPMPGGESLADVYRRLTPVADELHASARAGVTVAVVGHYWSNRLLLDLLDGVPVDLVPSRRDYKPANASALAIDVVDSAGATRIAATRWVWSGEGGR